MTAAPSILFSETEIARRVDDIAREIAPLKPEIAVSILAELIAIRRGAAVGDGEARLEQKRGRT